MNIDAYFGKETLVSLKRSLNSFVHSAAVRLIILIGLLSIFGSGIILYVISHDERRRLEEQAVEFSSISSDLIKRSIRHLMLTRNPEALQNSIENLADNDNIKMIRVFDSSGMVAYSSRPKEINTCAGTDMCAGCHIGNGRSSEALMEKRSWRIEEKGEQRKLIFLEPVCNEPSCYTAECHFHPQGRRILGLVETVFSVSHIDGRLNTKLRSRALFPIAFFCLTSLISGLFMLKFDHRRRFIRLRGIIGNTGWWFGRNASVKPADKIGPRPDAVLSASRNTPGAKGPCYTLGKEVEKRPGRGELLANAAFDSIRDPFIILDRDYRIVKANEAYAEMRGILFTNLMNAKCYEVIYGNDTKCNDCIIEKTFRSGDPCAKDKLIKLKCGAEAWFEIYTYPIHDEQGNVSHAIEYLRDITDRKKTEKTMKREYLELEQIFAGAADAMCVIDEKFTILKVNNMFLTLVGRTREDTVGQRCCNVFPGPECGSPNCHLTKMLRDPDRVIYFESERSLEDGKGAHFIITATPFRGPDGELLGIVEDFKDISERKEKENRLRSLSLQDELTGLCNRRGFMALACQELKMAARLQRGAVLLYSDLDGLKNINDSLGHEEGDRALKEVASVLKATFRTSDIIARIGGDEFVVIPTGTDAENAEMATERLRNNVTLCNSRTDRQYKISLSTGAAYYDPKCPCTINELLIKADTLMYEEKRRKRVPK